MNRVSIVRLGLLAILGMVGGLGVLTEATSASAPTPILSPTGYWEAASDGGVFSFGDAEFLGSMGGTPLNGPIAGIVATPDGKGYWLFASDGGVFAFGDAQFFGSTANSSEQGIVGMAATPDGKGYWLVSDSGPAGLGHPAVYSFGDAHYYGITTFAPTKPVVGIASTPDGKGYWLVASDGGVFSFGDAGFYGSMGGQPLNAPIAGITLDEATGGYWLVAADGGVFAFNAMYCFSWADVASQNTAFGETFPAVVGLASDPPNNYLLVSANGAISTEGTGTCTHFDYFGSQEGKPLNAPIVGMAHN